MPLGFTNAHPKFRVKGWGELLGSSECITAPEMVRHFLATGETGSGKSVSAVMPLLESILRYPEDDLYQRYSKEAGDAAERQVDLRPSVRKEIGGEAGLRRCSPYAEGRNQGEVASERG